MMTSTPLTKQITAWLFLSCLMAAVYAGDEDMNPTAYQRFDPETGFMVPIQQPHEGKQQNQDPSTQDTSDVMQSTVPSVPPTVTDQSTQSTPFWIYLLAGVALLAGLAGWIRTKKERTTPGHLD